MTRHSECAVRRRTIALAVLFGSTSLAGAADAAPGVVDEVIVTAQRRSESVQQVPAAITAVNAQIMAQRGITDVATLQFAVPSLTLGRSLGVTQVAIRGVGRSVGQPGVSSVLEAWVEQGHAPRDLVATDVGAAGRERTRPLCEYGSWPRYGGSGDPDSAASFRCERAAP